MFWKVYVQANFKKDESLYFLRVHLNIIFVIY